MCSKYNSTSFSSNSYQMSTTKLIEKTIGNFKIKEILGEGAFSTVFLCTKINANESQINEKNTLENNQIFYACKVIPRTKNNKKKENKRFDQEIRIHRLMHHPNVIQLIDVQKDSSFYYLFLEYAPCEELFNVVLKKGKLFEFEAAIYFKQILIGLQYIHSLNVAHRDMKPENILVDKFGRIKITDFGLSKIIENNGNNLTKTPCGSLCYSSPECLSGHPYDSMKSDIWSCGVILFVLTTGHLPWPNKSKHVVLKHIRKCQYQIPSFISFSCSDLIHKLMTLDPNKRITIDEALNHPFLKCVIIPPLEIDHKFVSLRKIDQILENDNDFEYNDAIKLLENEISESDSYFKYNILKVRKKVSGIEIDYKNMKNKHRVNSMDESLDIN